MQVAFEARHRHPPPRTDLDSRWELAGPAEPVKRVGVQTDPIGGIGYRDQVGHDEPFMLGSGADGHAAPHRVRRLKSTRIIPGGRGGT